jgi:hypothetical protein
VRDVAWRGGEEFNYRLRIGDFPTATTPLPMAAKRGAKTTIRFAGPNADSVPPVEVAVPADPNVEEVQVAPRGANGLAGWPVSLAVSDVDEVVEQEPNNEPAKATRVPAPGAVTGRFQAAGDVDHYVFALKKGARHVIQAHTHEFHSPSEVLLTLRDAKGGQLQATNPAAAPRLDFTPPADGDYTLVVEHLHGWGGPDEVYRVSVTPYEPGFDLLLPTDRLDLAPGGVVSIPVYLVRRDYTGPIEIGPAGVPGITGTATIADKAAPPPNQPAATLTLTAAADLASGPRLVRIQGKATINGKAVTLPASARGPVGAALANLPVPPRELYHEIALGVTEKPPFSLAAKFDQPMATPGKPATLTVTATRAAGFTAEVALAVTGQPPNVAPAVKPIPANQTSVQVQLNLAPNAPVGQFNITVNGKAKHLMRDYSVNAAPVPLVIKK